MKIISNLDILFSEKFHIFMELEVYIKRTLIFLFSKLIEKYMFLFANFHL